jgi:hypothetical protein
MAQGSYLSTYRTYKAGTKRLTTWLVQAAELCGVDITASTTDGYQIPLKQCLQLAQTITESTKPKITVPREIVTIIKTVIALRTDAGLIYARLTDKSINDVSNASHQYFISILEKVLKVLAPPSSPSFSNGSQAPAETRLANIFEALQLEELSPESDTTKPASTNKKAKSPPPQEYEIGDFSTSDSLFAVLGFLKDCGDREDGHGDLDALQIWTFEPHGSLCDDRYGVRHHQAQW